MNKRTLRLAGLALGLSMAVAGVGLAVGATQNKAAAETKAGETTTYNLTPNTANTKLPNTTYITTLTEFTYSGITWMMNQWNPSNLQVKTNQSAGSEFRFYNTSAFPGRITQVTVTFSALTLNTTTGLHFIGGASARTATSGGTSGTWNSSTKTVTWTPGDSDNFTFFAFYQNGKVATGTNYLASTNAIVVTYETTGGSSSSSSSSSSESSSSSQAPAKADVTLSLGSASGSMSIGAKQQLAPTATSNDEPVDGLTYSYSSSNTNVATVTAGGEITAVAVGSATITVTSAANDDYNAGSTTLALTVTEPYVIIDLDFPSCRDGAATSNYTAEWTATNNNYQVTVSSANNNFTDHIRMGRNGNASTPYISTGKVSERITSVVISFGDTVKTSIINSANLLIADNSSFTDAETIAITGAGANKTITVSIPNTVSSTNMYYKIAFDLASDTGNGNVRIKQVKFKAEPVDELESLAISGDVPTYTAGSAFAFGRTATAHYSISGDVAKTSDLTFTLGGQAIAAGDTIPTSLVGTKALVVTYTDPDTSESVSATAYNVTVNYGTPSSFSLNKNAVDMAVSGVLASTSLTATIQNQYASPSVIWATSDDSVVDLGEASEPVVGATSITVAQGIVAQGEGDATITATYDANGNGQIDSGETTAATCDVHVSAEATLAILYAGTSTEVTGTVKKNTGDAAISLTAAISGFGDGVSYDWDSSNEDIATVAENGANATLTIVGGGDSTTISVNVTDKGGNDETASFTLDVTTSEVTVLTVASSVVGGEIYDGTYNNTLTLTPAITTVGNATDGINWSSSDTDVATVSATSTNGTTPITVTGVGAGTAVITATSVYTPTKIAQYTVTVNADGVSVFSWTNKPYFDSASGHVQIFADYTTLEEVAKQGGQSASYGTFTPTWVSGKEGDTPSFGTGANDVHIVLSSTNVNSEEGLTPLSASSTFSNADNGKYVIAFYHGRKAQGVMPRLTVIKWRSVIEDGTLTETFDYSDGGELTQSGDISSASIAKGGSTTKEDDSLRLGSGSGTGSLTITSSTNKINYIKVWVKSYGTDGATLNVGTNNTGDISSDSFDTFEYTYDDPVTSVALSTTASKKRVYVQKVVIKSGGENEIGRGDDCLGIEEFIDTYLEWDNYHNDHVDGDTTGDRSCVGYYYGDIEQGGENIGAKAAFNELNSHQRELFTTNEAYADEWERLKDWAAANQEILGTDDSGEEPVTNVLIKPTHTSVFGLASNGDSTMTIAIILMASGLAAVGGYFFFQRRRKED